MNILENEISNFRKVKKNNSIQNNYLINKYVNKLYYIISNDAVNYLNTHNPIGSNEINTNIELIYLANDVNVMLNRNISTFNLDNTVNNFIYYNNINLSEILNKLKLKFEETNKFIFNYYFNLRSNTPNNECIIEIVIKITVG